MAIGQTYRARIHRDSKDQRRLLPVDLDSGRLFRGGSDPACAFVARRPAQIEVGCSGKLSESTPPYSAASANLCFNSEPGSRTPTLDENPPKAEPYPFAQPVSAQPYSQAASNPIPSPPFRPSPAPERGRTQLAVFWDAPENGPFAQLRIDNGELAGHTVPVTTTNFAIGALEG